MKSGLAFAGLLAAVIAVASADAAAQDQGGFRISGSAEIWAYGTGLERVGNSRLNPDNRVAKLPRLQWSGESRINLRLRSESTEIVLRPRLLRQHATGNSGGPDVGEAYLSQGFARLRLSDALTLTGGRELLTWGPANFRSPGNPLYFDAGRSNPLRDVSGVDLMRLTYTQGPVSLMLAREQSAGHLNSASTPEHTTLGKIDVRGEDMLLSALIATPVYGAPFVGGFGQATLGDAWLVYGEFGSGRRPQALAVNAAPFGAPFSAQSPAPRQTTALLGASYTRINGQSISLEWLRDGHGFSREQETSYFARAAVAANQFLAAPNSPFAPSQLSGLGQGIGQAPALLGRDYASLLWQSNPQESELYWRLMWTANLHDRSSQASLYVEKNLSPRFSAFLALTRNLGGVETDYGSLIGTSLTLGIKCFAF